MLKSNCIFIFFLCVSNVSWANYPSALPNKNLKDEISTQEDRLIPKSIDWLSASIDGESYLRTLGTDDFYHGVGYWIQARTELRPHSNFHINVRSIFYSGSVSEGYSSPTGDYHLVSFYGLLPHKVLGGKFEARGIDLGRQTIGNGLLIEQKEVAGLYLKWSRGGHSFKLMRDGTGGLVFYDDLTSAELNLFNGLIGGGSIIWTETDDLTNSGERRDPYYFLTSSYSFTKGFKYLAEAGMRDENFAALFALEIGHKTKRLNLKSRIQGRYYEDHFGDDFVGSIEHMYISYDQYDKNFTNTANVFTVDDNATAYSLILNLNYKINDFFELQSLNEVGQFNFKDADTENFYFYRAGIKYFPFTGRNEALTFFISNKVLTDSYKRPPSQYSLTNQPLFHEIDFFGIEASFSL